MGCRQIWTHTNSGGNCVLPNLLAQYLSTDKMFAYLYKHCEWGMLTSIFVFFFPGTPPGNLVFGCKSQWRLCCVIIPWQISEAVGENKRASYSGGRKGDGKNLGLGTGVLVGSWQPVPVVVCLLAVKLHWGQAQELADIYKISVRQKQGCHYWTVFWKKPFLTV